MKVYILIEDWAYDCDNGANILGVYSTHEQAKKELAVHAEALKKDMRYDTTEEKEGEYIDSYIDGFYNQDHEHIYIEEKEVKE